MHVQMSVTPMHQPAMLKKEDGTGDASCQSKESATSMQIAPNAHCMHATNWFNCKSIVS